MKQTVCEEDWHRDALSRYIKNMNWVQFTQKKSPAAERGFTYETRNSGVTAQANSKFLQCMNAAFLSALAPLLELMQQLFTRGVRTAPQGA